MSFLSGLFGRTKYEPTTRTVQTVSKLPEEIAPYVTDILEDAQAQYDKAVAEGYQPYGQETIAPRTQEELDAMAGLRGLIGGQGQYIDEAEAALRGIDTEFTAEAAQKFMSPYQQAVTDIEKRQAQEDFQRRVMPEFERQAVEAGGMSGLGSRAGVQAAQLGSAFSQQLGDIQAKGQQKAYEDAYRQFTDQGQRQRKQAEDLRNVGLQRFQTGLAEQGLGQQLAQQDRQEAQNILDKKFLEYLEQEQYPQQQLAQYSGLVYGNPLAKMANTTETTSGFRAPNAPGIGQQLLGLGLSGLNVFGMGGGFSPGGFSMGNVFSGGNKSMFRKTGGRIVYRQEGGEVPNVYNQGQQIAASPMMGSRSGLGGFFGGIFRPRQTNVIENIDNAAGSLNDYKETMDENMQNLRMATQAIGSSYNNTFGDRINLLGRIVGPQQATPTVAEMKAGGGLGSLPVVKKQVGSKVAPSGRLTQRQLEYLQSLRPAATDIRTRNILRDSKGRLPSYKRTGLTYDQRQVARNLPRADAEGLEEYVKRIRSASSPQLTASQLLDQVEPVDPVPANKMQDLQLAMANYEGESRPLVEILSGNPLGVGMSQRKAPVSAQGKATGLPALATKAGQPLSVEDAAKLVAAQGAEKIDATAQRRALANLADPDAGQAGPMTTDASGLTSISASSTSAPRDIRSRFKSLGFDPDENLAKAINTMFTSYEEGQRRDDDLIKKLEKSPKQLTKLAQDKINIEELSNKKQLAAQAEAIKARDLIDADFDKQDEDALNKYEERKMKRFGDRAKAWPGAEFAAAIDAGMDEPSIVTMLSKVMNVGVAGVSKRAEKIDNELDKFRDAMEEKQEALRGKKKTSAVNKASRKEQLASDKILKELGIDLKTADLPIQELKIYLAGLNTISQIKGRKFDKAAKMTDLLTDVFEETDTGSGTPIKTAGGLSLTDAKESAKVFNNLNLVPVGASRDKSIRAMSTEARKILNENPLRYTNKEKAARAEMSILETPENIKRLKEAAKKADPNITFKARTDMRQNTDPSNASSALINRGISKAANTGKSGK
jgi:hypothetical protein